MWKGFEPFPEYFWTLECGNGIHFWCKIWCITADSETRKANLLRILALGAPTLHFPWLRVWWKLRVSLASIASKTTSYCTYCMHKILYYYAGITKGQGPDFSKILWRTYEKLMQKSWLTKKLRINMWLSKTLQKSDWKLRTKLCKTDAYKLCITCTYHSKWCHSGNALSEAVIGQILWAKNNWQPEW